MNQEQYFEHEVRLRVLEETAKDIKESLHRLNDKMDNQFKWIIGAIIIGIFIPGSMHSLGLI